MISVITKQSAAVVPTCYEVASESSTPQFASQVSSYSCVSPLKADVLNSYVLSCSEHHIYFLSLKLVSRFATESSHAAFSPIAPDADYGLDDDYCGVTTVQSDSFY
jgi:hypothetical protein